VSVHFPNRGDISIIPGTFYKRALKILTKFLRKEMIGEKENNDPQDRAPGKVSGLRVKAQHSDHSSAIFR
jgi:hypothetical protein